MEANAESQNALQLPEEILVRDLRDDEHDGVDVKAEALEAYLFKQRVQDEELRQAKRLKHHCTTLNAGWLSGKGTTMWVMYCRRS